LRRKSQGIQEIKRGTSGELVPGTRPVSENKNHKGVSTTVESKRDFAGLKELRKTESRE